MQDVSFAIAPGERVAFIGPNGAGKSTTLKMLTGILTPTAGHAEVAGFVPWQQRRALARSIGIVFGQRSQLWYQLPVRASLTLLARIYAVERATAAREACRGTFGIADLLTVVASLRRRGCVADRRGAAACAVGLPSMGRRSASTAGGRRRCDHRLRAEGTTLL